MTSGANVIERREIKIVKEEKENKVQNQLLCFSTLSKKHMASSCENCPSAKRKICGRCRKQTYCSDFCRRQAWLSHRLVCETPYMAALKNFIELQASEKSFLESIYSILSSLNRNQSATTFIASLNLFGSMKTPGKVQTLVLFHQLPSSEIQKSSVFFWRWLEKEGPIYRLHAVHPESFNFVQDLTTAFLSEQKAKTFLNKLSKDCDTHALLEGQLGLLFEGSKLLKVCSRAEIEVFQDLESVILEVKADF